MRTYTWDEYYEKFYDWAESTRVRNLSALTVLGCADEVGEVIIELQENNSASNRLLKKAVEAKLEFSACELIEFLYNNDEELAVAAAYNSAGKLTAEDMEDLYGVLDDEVIIEICAKRKLTLPETLREEEEDYDNEPVEELDICVDDLGDDPFYEPPGKIGFRGYLLAIFGGLANIRKDKWD